jgi:F-type H+-transporting ATPase subunit b
MKIYVLILTVLSLSAFGAGDSHGGGSPWDLKWAYFNTLLLFGFLGFKLKGPMKEMFSTNAKAVAELYEFANGKEKEAQIRLESLQAKMKNIESEKSKIVTEVKNETENIIKKNNEELSEYLKRVESDTKTKLSTEKSTLERNLNNSLIDEVIKSTKEKIKSDSSVANKIGSNIMKQVK